jgi:hypothetical protein
MGFTFPFHSFHFNDILSSQTTGKNPAGLSVHSKCFAMALGGCGQAVNEGRLSTGILLTQTPLSYYFDGLRLHQWISCLFWRKRIFLSAFLGILEGARTVIFH